MSTESVSFFSSVISAGAILTGFCGSFLSFRIQREASYYRQPVLDFQSKSAVDVAIGLSHFSLPFLLLIFSALTALIFGVLIPLFGIAGIDNWLVLPRLTVAGLVVSSLLLCGYFFSELNHYEILNGNLVNDVFEKRRARPILLTTLAFALAAFLSILLFAHF